MYYARTKSRLFSCILGVTLCFSLLYSTAFPARAEGDIDYGAVFSDSSSNGGSSEIDYGSVFNTAPEPAAPSEPAIDYGAVFSNTDTGSSSSYDTPSSYVPDTPSWQQPASTTTTTQKPSSTGSNSTAVATPTPVVEAEVSPEPEIDENAIRSWQGDAEVQTVTLVTDDEALQSYGDDLSYYEDFQKQVQSDAKDLSSFLTDNTQEINETNKGPLYALCALLAVIGIGIIVVTVKKKENK